VRRDLQLVDAADAVAGDLILTHAVTNLVLSLFTIGTQRWVFWM
jgi:hypothetical protein